MNNKKIHEPYNLPTLDDFFERKDLNEVEDIFYYKKDDIKEMRTDNILKEMKDKQKTIKKDCPALLKNIDVMKSNADLLIFPKKRIKVKGDKEVQDIHKVVRLLADFPRGVHSRIRSFHL